MIVRDDQFMAFAATSLEELRQRVLEDEEKLKDKLHIAGGRVIWVLLLLSLTGWGLLVFTEPKPSWLSHLITAFTVVTLVYLAYRRAREIPVIREISYLRSRYENRVALIPIHLMTLPSTTFVALLTVHGGFDLFPVASAELEPILQGKLDDVCIVAPSFSLDAASASQVSVGEFEFVLNALAGGVGEDFVAPSNAEAVQIARLAKFEATVIRSN